ncbi:RP671a family tick cell line-upregulated protein [Rickettsia prowazekii]|uniref:Uncharacterized protein n=2 Tax=Rickettsia prowazekii TaxID=782 RepID=D5AXS8_RICPP|nr:hypothetical protein [Rickettsia prowazekii]ADE30217.1 hypothetical protein rpr22_CDS649 [Rickettsia prowazekii str. Rp22]AFE49469.1 hypothetical protein M9W_03220 [Rickettsia prowazekii str. Chernikova]AFE50313.1 hypothetical protein M9Y_03225 [Rickettsia prowazekii str. Katsinyian]AFE51159.1 hypothetical protein MA1_03215 [Rickettsia prowazekii str. BuV67-CWPP]AFE51995.1 hypothetical protein MA3_03260 [Rickettsia prowazekii str. Dachau]
MKNKEESNILPEFIIDEEERKQLKAKNSKQELKLILITFTIILTSFLTFCYFFFNYIEEKAAEYKLQREVEPKKIDQLND